VQHPVQRLNMSFVTPFVVLDGRFVHNVIIANLHSEV
jgi:hypothetical protein